MGDALHILVVDDATEEREIYCRLLMRLAKGRHVISEADTAARTLELLNTSTPDCVLLDYTLPDMNGLELLSHLDPDRHRVPIVFMSGTDDEDLARRLLRAGAQDYLCKRTVDAHSLERALVHAIERQRCAEGIRALNAEFRAELARRVFEMQELLRGAVRNTRLAAIGKLAAGVADDLSSPLLSVMTHVEHGLRHADPADAETRDALDNALSYARRCNEMVRELLEQSRQAFRDDHADRMESRVGCAVEAALLDTAELRRANGVEVTLDLPSDLPPACIEESALRHVMVNLVTNACHATKDSRERRLNISATADTASISVHVVDSGCGMAASVIEHAFEPFFTMESDSGTGLGLALCKTIVENAGGTIDVRSQVGSGSQFSVTLHRAHPEQKGLGAT